MMTPYGRRKVVRRGAAAMAGLALASKYRRTGTTVSKTLDYVGKYAAKAGTKVGKYIKKRRTASLHQKALPNIPGHGAGGTFSAYNMRRPLTKWQVGLKKNAASNFVYANSAQRLTSGIGVQAISLLSNTYANIDILNQFSSTNQTCKTIIESCTENSIIRNQNNNDCYLTLYDIVCRRDQYASTSSEQTPFTSWANGNGDAGASNMLYQVGTTPFSSPQFTQYFKVVKVTHIILPAGGTHEHRVHYEPNRLISREVATISGFIRNLTHFTMAVQYGAPDNDSSVVTTVSIGSSTLDVVQTKQYKYTYVSDAVTNNSFVAALPTSYPSTFETIIQDESGTRVADTTA